MTLDTLDLEQKSPFLPWVWITVGVDEKLRPKVRFFFDLNSLAKKMLPFS